MPRCGGTNEPPCKPVPTLVTSNGKQYWDEKAVDDIIAEAYQKGIKDQKALGQVIDYKKNYGILE